MTKFNEEVKKELIELMESSKHSIESASKKIGILNKSLRFIII